ncbi:hypothetical protein [Polyangium aurulentum]|uniref:hypothetical protein n=1 Tax=Polyangium aurulentum TaxID=2567896 RepID=UPI0010AEBE28|nr:hypothetical protein [Polyangium aurulentum]UQA61460.1 hypothetical protein E8A73_013690 [Polyangium aurulentum]
MRVSTKTALALLLLVPAAAGCKQTPKDRLQGRWLGETIENVQEPHLAKATGWVKGTAFEFSGNKVTVTIPAESPRTGTFRATTVEGDRVVVSFLREEGGRDEAELQFVGEGKLRWNIGEGREIVLAKAVVAQN